MNVHPACEMFPLMEGEEFQALVDDIAENGLLQPIVLEQGSHGMVYWAKENLRQFDYYDPDATQFPSSNEATCIYSTK